MTQDEKWIARYNEVVKFIETNKRNPSKYAPEEKLMIHFLKSGCKLLNAGELKEPRLRMFKELIRHIAMGRRCWLNSGSHDAAQNIAFMYSLYETSVLILNGFIWSLL